MCNWVCAFKSLLTSHTENSQLLQVIKTPQTRRIFQDDKKKKKTCAHTWNNKEASRLKKSPTNSVHKCYCRASMCTHTHTHTHTALLVLTQTCVYWKRMKGESISLSTVKTTPRPRAANKGGMRQRGAPFLPFPPSLLSNWLSCHGPNAIQTWLVGPRKARLGNIWQCLHGKFERRDSDENLSSSRQGGGVYYCAGGHTDTHPR